MRSRRGGPRTLTKGVEGLGKREKGKGRRTIRHPHGLTSSERATQSPPHALDLDEVPPRRAEDTEEG